MGKLECFKAKALALARSGYFYGLPPLEFELSFEEGFELPDGERSSLVLEHAHLSELTDAERHVLVE